MAILYFYLSSIVVILLLGILFGIICGEDKGYYGGVAILAVAWPLLVLITLVSLLICGGFVGYDYCKKLFSKKSSE